MLAYICKVCIDTWFEREETCPQYRHAIQVEDIHQASFLVRNLIAALQVKCDYHQDGCTSTYNLNERGNHLVACNRRPTECMDCHEIVPFNAMTEHLQNCSQSQLNILKRAMESQNIEHEAALKDLENGCNDVVSKLESERDEAVSKLKQSRTAEVLSNLMEDNCTLKQQVQLMTGKLEVKEQELKSNQIALETANHDRKNVHMRLATETLFCEHDGRWVPGDPNADGGSFVHIQMLFPAPRWGLNQG